jgi:hypothetical protein
MDAQDREEAQMHTTGYLEYGWEVFKKQTSGLVATAFCLVFLQMASQPLFALVLRSPLAFLSGLFLTGLISGGLMLAARRAMRGQEPTLSDAFEPFRARQGDYLLVGFAMAGGVIACFVGVFVTSFLFMFSPLLVADGLDFKAALTRSKDLVLANLGDCLTLYALLAAINVLGAISVVGWLASVPVSAIAVVKAYEQFSQLATLPGGTVDVADSTGS